MKRQDRLGMRVSTKDKEAWKEAAKAEGKSLSAWIEFILNSAAHDQN